MGVRIVHFFIMMAALVYCANGFYKDRGVLPESRKAENSPSEIKAIVGGAPVSNINEQEDPEGLSAEIIARRTGSRPITQPGRPLFCYYTPDKGYCSESFIRYYYNFYTSSCQPFFYSGCGGNENNFLTSYQCRRSCEAL